jgi:hypothetical protein
VTALKPSELACRINPCSAFAELSSTWSSRQTGSAPYQLLVLLENSFGCRIFGQFLISAAHSCPQLSTLPRYAKIKYLPPIGSGVPQPHNPHHPTGLDGHARTLVTFGGSSAAKRIEQFEHEDRVARQMFTRPFSVRALAAETDIRESYTREDKNCEIAERGGPPDGPPPTYGKYNWEQAVPSRPLWTARFGREGDFGEMTACGNVFGSCIVGENAERHSNQKNGPQGAFEHETFLQRSGGTGRWESDWV